MLLFFISFLLVFTSSYFITSVIAPKKSILGFIYILLIAFAQIVLTFEVLSLFTAINQYCVIGANVLIFLISGFVWNKMSRPKWSLSCKDFRNQVNNSFKLDKALMWLYVGLCVFIITAVILNILLPITNSDAQAYHVARSMFWVAQGSLNHFNVADVRNLCLPINSEILYSWVLLLLRKDAFLGFFAFFGYVLTVVSVYNILGHLGYCTRKKLWVIFILSSFPSVFVQASGTETDIILAGLVTSCIFLFWYALKHNKTVPLFMASLAYALAIGTKTPSIIAIPAVGIFLLGLCFHYKKFKPLGIFLGFGIVNFLIFSSYNYILNFIHYSNFMGDRSFMIVSKNYYGIKGMFANFIKYIFMFFDFTGFRWGDYIRSDLEGVKNFILSVLNLSHVNDGIYSTLPNVNRSLLEPVMGAGLLGFVVYLPCVLWSFIKPIFNFKSQKSRFLLGFAGIFVINLLVMSYLLAYMIFSVRFVMFFMVLSSPILIYSYFSKKNPLKYFIVFFALFYLVIVSTHLWARPLTKIIRVLSSSHSISHLREMARCKDYEINPQYLSIICPLRDRIRSEFKTDNKILAFIDTSSDIYQLKSMYFEGYDIDFATLEDYENIDFDKYNIVISSTNGQTATVIKNYENNKDNYKMVGRNLVFKKETLIPCVYYSNLKISNAPSRDSYPFQARCGMSERFVKQHKLKMIGRAGLITPASGSYSYFVILQNNNMPIYYKKR